MNDEEITVSGSGFFVSPDGIIVTNYHVIQTLVDVGGFYYPSVLSEIKVIANSGTQSYKPYRASIISIDKENDLTLLKINDTIPTPYLEIDYDENLIESSPISAYGYPLGEEFGVLQRGPEITLSKGYISAVRHDDRGKISKIQIDASVKHGNSGGPLVSSKGKVIGIVYQAYGNSGMNFAIPTCFLKPLIDSLPRNFNDKDSVLVTCTSAEQSTVFMNGKRIGTTPVSTKVIPGVCKILFTKQGFQSCFLEKSILRNTSVNGILNKITPIVVPPSNITTPEKTDPFNYDVSDQLFKEDFNNSVEFDKWEQNTGGQNKRTWFIENGVLNQFESDGLLHVISFGDSLWENYEISAKIKITDKHDDSRAGIIFRETDNGFYLFRIHKESQKAQLAYHSKNPFGWFVLMEKEISKVISNDWFSAKVVVSGNNICCFLDTTCIFSTIAEYSPGGKTGFYSVESKASFDSVIVNKINIKENNISAFKTNNLLSFWFSDYFNQESTFWYPYYADNLPSSFEITDGGLVQSLPEKKTKYCELTKFMISDFQAQYAVSFSGKDTNACFELYFRKDNTNSLSIKFSAIDKKVYLIQTKESVSKILAKNTLPDSFFKSIQLLTLTADGNSIKCGSYYYSFINYKGKKIITSPGFTGFDISDARFIAHQFRMVSVKNLSKK
ncbi:MAG: S1C family serine protease [Bacteroidetes bacterium]|nr:S1C family serine protease [Bacteroidota bacterium]